MRNLKTSFLIFLAILLLAGFAALPVIAASLQDNRAANQSGYQQMQTLKLEYGSERGTRSIMSKLALFGMMQTIDIDSSQAAMTQEEAFLAAETQMKAYEEAGIFQWFDVAHRSATPKLGLDPNDATNYAVYWTVTYISEKNRTLLLDIDDETGKILRIDYMVYESFPMDGVWERNQKIMNAFTDIYFSQLGMTEAKKYAESEAGFEYYERDGGVSNALYSFGDVTYGEVTIDFYVEGAGGFYLYYPN